MEAVMQKSLYINTEDLDGHAHAYRLPVTDTIPEGHEITSVRPAGLFPVTALLSPEGVATLNAARVKATGAFRK
jgi:hypothetical protein